MIVLNNTNEFTILVANHSCEDCVEYTAYLINKLTCDVIDSITITETTVECYHNSTAFNIVVSEYLALVNEHQFYFLCDDTVIFTETVRFTTDLVCD